MGILRLGTRKSELALAQTKLVQQALHEKLPNSALEIVSLTTSGDTKQNLSEGVARDKKDWIKELEDALLSNTIDCAVHSAKDVPSDIAAGTIVLPVLNREYPFDCFIAAPNGPLSLIDLQKGARIGSSSLRRRAQLLRHRPDLEVIPLRGNVPTRVRKLNEDGNFHGIVLAEAGIRRLGLDSLRVSRLDGKDFLPAVNQGILCVQCRSNDSLCIDVIRTLAHEQLQQIFRAEREFIHVLGADCNSAVSVFAELRAAKLTVSGAVYAPDGSQCLYEELLGAPENALSLGQELGKSLIKRGAKALLSAKI